MVTIKEDMSLLDIQNVFTGEFPYLKIGFFRTALPEENGNRKVFLKQDVRVRNKSKEDTGQNFVIREEMTVTELEQLFKKQFGLSAQIFRKSGRTWLETKMTSDWSLKKQNHQGFELSVII
ncbi:MAG: hypothetical protein JNL60_01515 [Bacteroidia bacterium]|nr:hypothetical protein [Bacteroidia bacterium]